MNRIPFSQRPRLLAGLALAFALVPAVMAVVAFLDGKFKDQLVFETTAQTLAEQLQHSSERNTYLLNAMLKNGRDLDEAGRRGGKLKLPLRPETKLPHLLAVGYAESSEGRLIIRWMDVMREAVARVGDDLAQNGAIRAVMAAKVPGGAGVTKACLLQNHRMLAMLELPGKSATEKPRGYVLGWVDLDSMCHDESLPLVRDRVLTATPFADGDAPRAGALIKQVNDEAAPWQAEVVRGEKFGTEYSPSTPWLAFVATGLSALPLLVLASLAARSTRFNAELVAEREISRQQRLFTQSVSHEFRTPLGVILSGTDLLDRYLEHLTPERQGEVLGEIRANTLLMSGMVEQVLLLGRIESGRSAFRPKPVNVAALCADIVRKARAAAGREHAVEISAPDVEALLDASLLGSALDNLISNAIKYSPTGRPVRLDARLESSQITFTVADEGIGIPADEVARACDPFHRCSNVGTLPGTGLGLAIASRCVAVQGGRMNIESAEGKGTTIQVTLPLIQTS